MGMRGGMQGMQGMQGQQGMQQMQMMPPEEEEEPEIREKQVQQALEFVEKPEVAPSEDDDDEAKEKKMEQIKEYLDKNMGLNEDEMNAVLKRSGLDPTAGDSSDDSSSESDEEDDEELDYEAQQNHDMRGSIPAPVALSLVALLVSAPNHRAWWQWVMGSQPAPVGTPLQQQLRPGVHAAAAPPQTPPIVVVNQPPGGAAAARAQPWGARRWIITLIGFWFVVTWIRTNWTTMFLPQLRTLVATVAESMGLDVQPMPEPDPYAELEDDQGFKEDVQSLRNELRTLRSTLSENKRIALRRFEEHRQRDSRAALRQLQDKGQKPADPP